MKQSSLLVWSQANRNPQEIQLAKSIPWTNHIFVEIFCEFFSAAARGGGAAPGPSFRVADQLQHHQCTKHTTKADATPPHPHPPPSPPVHIHKHQIHHIHHKQHQCTSTRSTTPVHHLHHQCRCTITSNSTPGPPPSVNKHQLHQHQCKRSNIAPVSNKTGQATAFVLIYFIATYIFLLYFEYTCNPNLDYGVFCSTTALFECFYLCANLKHPI